VAVCATALIASGAGAQSGEQATVVGTFSVERPTLKAAGFDWWIEGDANRNASVSLEYRRQGEEAWRKGMDLLRLHHEDVNAAAINNPPPGNGHPDNNTVGLRPPLYYRVPNMFSGSLFGLEPSTDYEARLTLRDPDGVRGETVQTASFRTRAEPMPAQGGNVYHVYPWDHQGPKQEPWFTGLLAAYFMEARHADWSNASPPRVQPGDTILVHAGVYKDDVNYYGYGGIEHGRLATTFDGTYHLTVDGTAEKPIVIKGAGDGEAIFDGGGNAVLFNLMGADYTYIEGITVRNTDVGFLLGRKHVTGADGFTLKRSRLENVGRGVHADWSGSRDFYIADNLIVGRHDPKGLMGWTARFEGLPGFPEAINGPHGTEYGIKVYGQGHVVAYNTLRNMHDGIDVATYGDPDGAPQGDEARMPLSIDFYGNDFYNMADNCIEADGGGRNVRVYDNRCLNIAGGGFSAQTIFGGPAYFVRNLVYTGIGGSLKLSITPTGVLVYNNSFIAEENNLGLASNVHLRNNLFVSLAATPQPSFGFATMTRYSTSDYNGIGWVKDAQQPLSWSMPPVGTETFYDKPPPQQRFANLAALRRATGQERNGRQVDLSIFEKMPEHVADIRHLYPASDVDFSIRLGSAAVDAGMEIPTITDGFAGKAPDLGAIEQGRPVPHYGVRPQR